MTNLRPLTTTTLAHQNMGGFQHIRPTTGAPHVIQQVRRAEDVNNNNPQSDGVAEAESLGIRTESGESLEDIVSVMSIEEVYHIHEIEIYIVYIFL